ncbi:MAG TPA: MFS transporter [Burkholderiaceae bacterium]
MHSVHSTEVAQAVPATPPGTIPTFATPSTNNAAWAEPGTSAYRRISLALFLAGFATFSLLYCVQPLLPLFAADFHVSAAASALALSFSTGCLAFAILCAGALSENLGRRMLMFTSMALAALLNIAAALVPGWHALLVLRALEGLALGGVPAVAMAYLAEEIHPRGLGRAMGLYVAGTAFGGMVGRVGMSLLTDFHSWRMALAVVGAVDLLAAIGFVLLLPPSRHFTRKRGFDLAYHLGAWGSHLRHPALPLLFAVGFLVMGMFVTVYNYAGFRLMRAPFNLSQGSIGLIFTAYLFGIAASAMAGGWADRRGRAPVLLAGLGLAALGVLLTLPASLPLMVLGIVLITFGFFVSHSVASAWVGRLGGSAKGHAASLYLLAYYLGSSMLGAMGGWFWEHAGWSAVAGYALLLLAITVAAALALRHRAAAR